jgi:hypothetical protein
MLVFCQDITGFWSGTLFNDDTQQSLPYEIYIAKDHGKLTGYSQTWVTLNDKRYYAIKKLSVRIAKDGKVVMQDASLVENNYPFPPNKNVIQLDVLDLLAHDNEPLLDGAFVTNSSRNYGSLSGRIHIKKVSSLIATSQLAQYLQKNNTETDVTALK